MTVQLDVLSREAKLLFDVPLAPVQGRRFQPTGFPDLGAATYPTPDGKTGLLVESAQSMANRLEAICWDEGAQDLVEPLRGLSYVRVIDKGDAFLTSSVHEAHRLNSAYIEKAEKNFAKGLAEEVQWNEGRPVNRRAFIDTLLKYDAGSLIHGVFLESIGGRLRIARALSAFIEADNVSIAASGGVKNDNVRPGKEGATAGGAAEGFGNVPFAREEYTAEAIHLYANLDLAQVRGYGLDAGSTRMLILLSLFKLRALLDGNLRLRTACDLHVDGGASEIRSTNVQAFVLPARDVLESALKASIQECASKMTVRTVKFAS